MKKWHIVLSLIFLIIVVGYVDNNLKTNSVYYAKHMPRGERQLPEATMLINYMDYIYMPNIEGLKYNLDGTRTIKNSEGSRYFSNGYDHFEYIYSDEMSTAYIFDEKFQLKYVIDSTNTAITDGTEVDTQKLIDEIESLIAPVVYLQPTPTINLQWLFNLIYQGQFE